MALILSMITSALSGAAKPGAVKLIQTDGRIHIDIDGQPFSDFYSAADKPKPYLHPLRSASGKIVTRRFPMEAALPGEPTNDQHQRALWLGYGLINGFNFWENELSYHDPKAGTIAVRHIDSVESGAAEGRIVAALAWCAPSGETLFEELRTMVFRGTATERIIDLDIGFRAVVKTTFGDNKNGLVAIRLAEPLIEKHGGTILNSAGGHGMSQTWGKPADWVDYSGTVEGEAVGVALLSHPANFHAPPRWHVRDYGLLAANPFAVHAYDSAAPETPVTLEAGQTIRLRYRVVIHGKVDGAALETIYREYASHP
jgi:hypothetical protein